MGWFSKKPKEPEPKVYRKTFACDQSHVVAALSPKRDWSDEVCHKCGGDLAPCVALGRVEVHSAPQACFAYLVDAEFVRWL